MNLPQPIRLPEHLAEKAHAAAMERGADCRRCVLFGARAGPVPSTIVPNARLAIIGEAPGGREVARGENFVGPSGIVLDQSLREGGLARQECSVLNTIACQPPEEFTSFNQKLKVQHEIALRRFNDGEEGAEDPGPLVTPSQACRPRLLRDLEESNARVWLAVGGQALRAVAEIYQLPYSKRRKGQSGLLIKGIKNQHGAPVYLPDGKILTSSYHPAFAMRPGSRQFMPVVKADLARGARIAVRGCIDWFPPDAIIAPTIEQVEATCARFVESKTYISLDIETDGKDPRKCRLRCVGLGGYIGSEEVIIVVPFLRKNGSDYWPDIRTKLRAHAAVRSVVNACEIVGHNVVQYDSTVLLDLKLQDDRKKIFDDTMLMTKDTDHCDLPKNLEFVVSRWLESPAWKIAHTEDKTDG